MSVNVTDQRLVWSCIYLNLGEEPVDSPDSVVVMVSNVNGALGRNGDAARNVEARV